MIVYSDANPTCLAFVVEDGWSNYHRLPQAVDSQQAEFIAIVFALNSVFIRHNKELDARQQDVIEGKFVDVGSPADRTKRLLPPPIEVRCDNQVAVRQLNRQAHISRARDLKLCQQIWNMTANLQVRFTWIPSNQNKAGRMLR